MWIRYKDAPSSFLLNRSWSCYLMGDSFTNALLFKSRSPYSARHLLSVSADEPSIDDALSAAPAQEMERNEALVPDYSNPIVILHAALLFSGISAFQKGAIHVPNEITRDEWKPTFPGIVVGGVCGSNTCHWHRSGAHYISEGRESLTAIDQPFVCMGTCEGCSFSEGKIGFGRVWVSLCH